MGYGQALILSGSCLVAFFCALNAILDFRSFKLFGRVVCFIWFAFISAITIITIWSIGTMKRFSTM